MKFDVILLMLIATEPGTGYDMRRRLSTEGVFIRANADQSQIYRTLAKLQQNGFIDFVEEKRENAPDAKVYSATPAGVKHLWDFTETDYDPPARWQEADFGAHYRCLMWINPEAVPRMLRIELKFRREQIAKYRNRERIFKVVNPAIDVDLALVKEFSDLGHDVSAQATDEWVEWVESLLALWTQRLSERAQRRAAAQN
ncbi:PadR family transcriptional regulator [Arthrobacter sp. GMC3]|uniref:PadR family transcriptional regulator n=1 Tax=Arthrobacter sp. GMC3 TaxID=2058894 RepID=UPI0015E2ECD7|nr:PadR family transcriptional regulator [Arthrobacter sp. GMC3]